MHLGGSLPPNEIDQRPASIRPPNPINEVR
jgi:hypothetical protein